MSKRILCYAVASLLSLSVYGQYTYESGQDLYHLQTNANNFEGELAYEVADDGISPTIDLSFNFTFYGSTFSQARMATNGCLHFGSSGSYCSDYTPDPINGQHTYTIYPFWTDLIRDNDSRMKSWGDSSKMIFGWYDMREYNRASDNSFEIILWNNSSFDIRYGALDIINHDVLIGEVGSKKEDSYTYYYHDECNTGTTNSSSCYNYDWNNSDKNTNLENGGSLYGSGSGNGVDCSNALNDPSCSGYADAYQTQQCNITQLYNESCPLYWEAYDDEQCDQDPQYAPFCQGYRQEESVAFFDDEQVDYGYEEEEQFGYEQEPMFEEFVFEEQRFEEQEFMFEEEIIFEQMFAQEEYQEPFEPMHDTPMHEEEAFLPMEDLLIDEFIFQETFLVEDFREPETFIELETIDQLEEWFEEETRREEEIAILEEPEEEFLEEIFEEEVVEEIFEAIEERMAEAEIEEERIEREEVTEEFQEVFEEEFEVAERENVKGESSISREIALKIVSATITTAKNSISGTDSGNSVHATGGGNVSGNSANSSSNSGISVSNSPSMSDQFASSTAQTNQVLDMSNSSVSDSSFSSDTIDADASGVEVVVADLNTETTQDQMDTSIVQASTDSESETTVESIIAQNLQDAQEQVTAQQEETGEYGSENAIIAVMGFVPEFNNYRLVNIPQKESWYMPKNIYTNNTLSDNTEAFYGLAGQSIRTLTDLKNLQPNL